MKDISKGLLKGSLILLIAFNLFNLLNFFFQFSMARFLDVSDFGTLATLMSLLYILAVFNQSIQLIIAKYVSTQEDEGKIKNILRRSIKKSTKYSTYIFLVYLLISYPLSKILEINYWLIFIVGFMIFGIFLTSVTRGVLQGKKKFKGLGSNIVFEGALKLALSIGLVIIGFKVYGAITGVVVSTFIALGLSFYQLKEVISSKERDAKTPDIYSYSRPIFFILLFSTIFFSMDIILAKIFFNDSLVGEYAIASTLAKIVFLGTSPIGKAMFPVSASQGNGGKSKPHVLMKSLALLIPLILLVVSIISLFASKIVYIFSNKVIPSAVLILPRLSIAIGIFSISHLILTYKASVSNTKNYLFLALSLISEFILLSIFSYSLESYSLGLIGAALIFLLFSLLIGKR